MPVTSPIAFNPGGVLCGANPGSAMIPDYQAPFRFLVQPIGPFA
jgi:arylsulfatase